MPRQRNYKPTILQQRMDRFAYGFSLVVLSGWVLAVATYAIASVVFAIQALVVGYDTYKQSECASVIGMYLVWYGCFFFALCLVCLLDTCCVDQARSGSDKNKSVGPMLLWLIMYWLYKGYVVVHKPGTQRECNPSQFEVFERLVLFMVWGGIGLMGGILIAYCVVGPILQMIWACLRSLGGKCSNAGVIPYQTVALQQREDTEAQCHTAVKEENGYPTAVAVGEDDVEAQCPAAVVAVAADVVTVSEMVAKYNQEQIREASDKPSPETNNTALSST